MSEGGSYEIIRKQLDELMGKDRDGAMVESITVSWRALRSRIR